jgi:hypothetical protein
MYGDPSGGAGAGFGFGDPIQQFRPGFRPGRRQGRPLAPFRPPMGGRPLAPFRPPGGMGMPGINPDEMDPLSGMGAPAPVPPNIAQLVGHIMAGQGGGGRRGRGLAPIRRPRGRPAPNPWQPPGVGGMVR